MESSSLIVFPFRRLCTSLLLRETHQPSSPQVETVQDGRESKMAGEKTNCASNDVPAIVTSFLLLPLYLRGVWRDYLPAGGVTVG